MMKLRLPTIDETRAFIQIGAALTLIATLLFMIFSGQWNSQLVITIVVALVSLVNGVNGIALHMRNSSGKRWTDPSGERQDTLPMQPDTHDEIIAIRGDELETDTKP